MLRYFLLLTSIIIISTKSWAFIPTEDENYPIAKGSTIEQVINAYLSELILLSKTEDQKEAFKVRIRTQGYWRLKINDTSLPSMKSSIFFTNKKPSKWEIKNIDKKPNSAIASILFTTEEKDLVAEYYLVKYKGNWYLSNFKANTSISTGIKPTKQNSPEQNIPAPSIEIAKSTLTNYLETLFSTIKNAEIDPNNPSQQFLTANKTTKKFWIEGHDKKRSPTQSAAFFITMQPKSWEIISTELTGDIYSAKVKIIPNGPIGNKIGERVVTYELIAKEGKWYLFNYKPPVFE